MKFSIITTFYNNTVEEVEKLKESILNQSYSKWEWIISDDFSQESTQHIDLLKSLPNEDKRIKYVDQKFKKEIFWNPQTYASGDIIMLIGADDWISQKTLEIFCYHFVKYPDLILITSESNIYRENYQLSSSIFLSYLKEANALDRIKNSTFHNWLNMGVPLTWRNIPIDFTEGFQIDNKSIINDYLIHLRLEEIGKFTHLPRIFYHCKIRENSVSRKIDENNNFLSNEFTEVTDLTTKKRNNSHINSFVDIYNSIVEESKVFYYSKLNTEKNCQNISFITPNEELNTFKQSKIKDLYFDHNLYFNKIDSSIDYYFFYLDEDATLDKFVEFFSPIHNCKEISILLIRNDMMDEVTPVIQNFWWNKTNNKTWIKASK